MRVLRRVAMGSGSPNGGAEELGFAGHYWPTAEQELVLRAALLSGPEMVSAWRDLRPRLDLTRMDAGSKQLLPLLGANLRRHGIDDPILDGCDRMYSDTVGRNRLLFRAAAGVVRELAAVGIEVIVLKGWALAERWYGDVGLRPMSDVDILVPRVAGLRAVNALERGGWSARQAVTPPYVRTRHAAPFTGPGGQQCDLHWWVFEEYCPASADDDFWASSVEVDLSGVSTRVLAPSDQLLHVCIHGAKWARIPGIRWIADALLILRAGEVDWQRLISHAVRRRFVLRTQRTLCYLRAVMGAPIPDETLVRLLQLPVAPLERFEHWVRARDHKLMGSLPFHWSNYLRSLDRYSATGVLAFPHYLQQVWGLESIGRTPRGALARVAKRIRGSLGRGSLSGRPMGRGKGLHR